MNIFITGTDTNIGKTIISAWICHHTKSKYWKPIQTGDDSDSDIISKLSPQSKIIPNVYRLKEPLSPYDSSNLENTKIDINRFLETTHDKTVIEGAGGILVPISKNFQMIDLAKELNSKVLIVAESKLGFLNHIFLTVNAIRQKNLEIVGIIINGETENFLIKTIEEFSKVKVLKILPRLNSIEDLIKKETDVPQEIKEILL